MTEKKKDLTRIEEMGNFLHELNADDDATSFEPDNEREKTRVFKLDDDFNNQEESAPSFEEETPPPPVEETWQSEPEMEESPISFDPPEEIIEEEPEVRSATTPVFEDTPLPSKSEIYKAEDLSDLKEFAENISYSSTITEGNPSFSLVVKNIRFHEDADEIFDVLKEMGFSNQEEQTKQALRRGTLLIPRISEFAAVKIAHALRKYDVDLEMGLSDEIHPPKYGAEPEKGLVSKFHVFQNRDHHFDFSTREVKLSDIILSTTSQLEGYHVKDHMGVVTQTLLINSEMIEHLEHEKIDPYYAQLQEHVKLEAHKKHANAVIGLSYQLTPLLDSSGLHPIGYQLLATGSLVWLIPIKKT